MRSRLIIPIIALLALAPMLGACESFDLDSLDVFGLGDKKKLPGDRKALFPEGVPGVSQGIPPELVKGAQPAQTADVPPVEPAAEPKPRKPRVARKPTQITVQPQSRENTQENNQAPANNAQQPPPAGSFQR